MEVFSHAIDIRPHTLIYNISNVNSPKKLTVQVFLMKKILISRIRNKLPRLYYTLAITQRDNGNDVYMNMRETNKTISMIELVTHYNEQLIAAIGSLLSQLTQQPIIFGEEELRSLIANNASHLFIMREQEEVVGMLTLGTYLSPTGRKAWVEDVVVDIAYRSRGYGRELIHHAIRYCEENLSPCTLMLTSNPQREAANALYRTSGFEQKITNVYKLNCPDNE